MTEEKAKNILDFLARKMDMMAFSYMSIMIFGLMDLAASYFT